MRISRGFLCVSWILVATYSAAIVTSCAPKNVSLQSTVASVGYKTYCVGKLFSRKVEVEFVIDDLRGCNRLSRTIREQVQVKTWSSMVSPGTYNPMREPTASIRVHACCLILSSCASIEQQITRSQQICEDE